MEPSIIQQNGYVWIALPREGILPLTILEQSKENILKRIGNFISGTLDSAEALNANLYSLFPKPTRGKVPKSSNPEEVAFFKGHDVLNVKAGIAVNALEKLPIVANAKVLSKLAVSTKLLFSFKNIKRLHVDNDILLREHISISKSTIQSADTIEKLQTGKMYVVSEVLQTTEFTVRDASDFSSTNEISADAIDDFISLQANLESEKESDQKLAYKGELPITFALKAYKILYDKGKYTLSKSPLKIVRGEQKEVSESFQTDDGIVFVE